MNESSGFFNSINGDRIYDASDVASFLKKFFTNGVFNNTLKVSANDNMSVYVSAGSANINGYSYNLSSTKTLELQGSSSEQSRIDSVVLRLDLNNRNITLNVINGTFADTPSAPNITRTDTIYDLRLANIKVSKGVTRVTDSDITDTRFTSDCGNVTQAVLSLDTEDIFKQYQSAWDTWFNTVKGQLTTDQAGNLQAQIDKLKANIGVSKETSYDSSKTYNTDSFITHDGLIYRCNSDSVTGDWDPTKWDEISIRVDYIA